MLRRTWFTGLSALAGLALSAVASAGEVVVVSPPAPCPPLVSVKAGDPARPVVSVNIPGLLRLEVRAHGRLLRRRLGIPVLAPPVALPVAPPLDPAPPPMAPVEGELPAPRPLAPNAPAPVPTLAEFGTTFRPCAGTHEVTVLHPDSGRPVLVRFDLPRGTPKVRVERREIEFNYDREDIEIRFLRNGTVRVEYD